jgi:acetyl-CoA carboxylase biotin carboxyl carrier protein
VNSGPDAPAAAAEAAPGRSSPAEGSGGSWDAAVQSGASASTRAPEIESTLAEITSPMVGTFYRAAAPDQPPFTDVGKRISTGDTLCIIEAMKLMNELEAEIEGVVQEVCVANGEPVEYGQVLFRVEPA